MNKGKILSVDAWITIGIVLIGVLLPGIGPLTDSGVLILACFIAVLYSWIRGVNACITLGLALFYGIFNGISITNTLVSEMFGSLTIWMLIFVFWFAEGLKVSGALEYLGNKILSLKFATKGPIALMFTFMLASWISSAVVQSAAAVLIVMMALMKSITKELGIKQLSSWTALTAIGCGVVASLGNLLFPFSSASAMYFALFKSTLGALTEPNFIAHTLTALLTTLLTMAAVLLLAKFVFCRNVEMKSAEELESIDKNVKMTKGVKWTFITLLVFALLLIIPSILPDGNVVGDTLDNFGLTGASAVALIMMCFITNDKGEKLFDFSVRIKDATPWAMIIYMSPLMYFGGLMSDTETGIPSIFSAIASPLEGLSPMLILFFIGLLVILFTNVMNNMIPCILFGPIGFALLGYDTVYAAMLMTILVTNAFTAVAVPSASFAALVLHGDKELISSKQLITYGYLVSVIMSIIASCVLIFITRGLF